LPPRVDYAKGLRWSAAGAKVGGAILALAVIASSRRPELVLGLLGIALLVAGGTAWTRGGPGAVPIRILVSLGAVVVARLAFGTSGALLASVLLVMGACLRLRLTDAVAGLAVFGGMVAFLGDASLRLALAFWVSGVATVLLRALAPALYRRVFRRRSLIAEKAKATPLAPES